MLDKRRDSEMPRVGVAARGHFTVVWV